MEYITNYTTEDNYEKYIQFSRENIKSTKERFENLFSYYKSDLYKYENKIDITDIEKNVGLDKKNDYYDKEKNGKLSIIEYLFIFDKILLEYIIKIDNKIIYDIDYTGFDKNIIQFDEEQDDIGYYTTDILSLTYVLQFGLPTNIKTRKYFYTEKTNYFSLGLTYDEILLLFLNNVNYIAEDIEIFVKYAINYNSDIFLDFNEFILYPDEGVTANIIKDIENIKKIYKNEKNKKRSKMIKSRKRLRGGKRKTRRKKPKKDK